MLGKQIKFRSESLAADLCLGFEIAGVNTLGGRLSWRTLLSAPCHHMPCTEQDRFCGRAALAALPRQTRCRCMPDIFARSDSRLAFSFESLRCPQ
jgi:hypothetical protein